MSNQDEQAQQSRGQDPVLRRIADCEMPGGQYMNPESPPVLPESVGDVLFHQPGDPPRNFLDVTTDELVARANLEREAEED